jgi:hypothetical protein
VRSQQLAVLHSAMSVRASDTGLSTSARSNLRHDRDVYWKFARLSA